MATPVEKLKERMRAKYAGDGFDAAFKQAMSYGYPSFKKVERALAALVSGDTQALAEFIIKQKTPAERLREELEAEYPEMVGQEAEDLWRRSVKGNWPSHARVRAAYRSNAEMSKLRASEPVAEGEAAGGRCPVGQPGEQYTLENGASVEDQIKDAVGRFKDKHGCRPIHGWARDFSGVHGGVYFQRASNIQRNSFLLVLDK